MKSILAGALDVPAPERDVYLSEACGTEMSLRHEVDSLLASYTEAGAFLNSQQMKALPDPRVGEQIGPYRLERMLGQGGMGAVYLASREVDGFTMRVALKLIRVSVLNEYVHRRFRMERQILARLSHPNITRLIDGGIAGDGVPFLVTEFVDGIPLDEYVRTKSPSLQERLRLFEAICSAVAFAHRNLIVHGDLKPHNILVNAEGQPKLLDFGIARLIDPESSSAGEMTLEALTPAWASPEQLRGEPLSPSSDAYSLGRLMYFLLTGQQPFDLTGQSPPQILTLLSLKTPPLPSEVTAKDDLKGDLDNIALKAMEFETALRYPSVDALAEDLRRHRESLPISAHPTTATYRVKKFVRRHRALVLAVTAVTLSLLAGLGMTIWQARLARENYERSQRLFSDVRKLANSFIFDMDDAVAQLPSSTSVRARMVRNAIGYLDRLASESSGDAQLQEELAAAYEKIGDVQGRPSSANLGDTAAALASYRKAEKIRESIFDESSPTQRDDLARTYLRMSSILRAVGDFPGALEYDRKALAIRLALLEADPENIDMRRSLAATYTSLSGSFSLMAQWDGVLENRKKAFDAYQQIARRDPDNESDQRSLALAHYRMSSILLFQKNYKDGLEHSRRALESMRPSFASIPAMSNTRSPWPRTIRSTATASCRPAR
ncbi:MAG: serine/threonine protein kinase [Acidobacteria bacterium]|nr:serine/threonine protein kinase [Acidobacteriota bacterium]